MNSRLDISMNIDDNGNLWTVDETDYSIWGLDVCNHTVIERVIDFDNNVINTKIGPISRTSTIELITDGAFVYQRLVLPTYEHGINSDCYYYNGKICLNGMAVDFDTAWNVRTQNMNIFWFDNNFFSMANLLKCFVLTEQNRLNQIFSNGCRIQCTNNPDGAKADFLASAVFVMRYLVQNGQYDEAQALLNRIQTCNGLCKDVRKSLKGCGCGLD